MLSRLLTRKEQVVLLGFAAALLLGAVAIVVHGRANKPEGILAIETSPEGMPASRPATPPPIAPIAPAVAVPLPAVPAPVVVSIQGAVRNPGVYENEGGERVQDLIDRAGGLRESADLMNINLAAKLVDGTTLVIPSWAPDDPWTAQAEANPAHYTLFGQGTAAGAVTEGGLPTGGAASTTTSTLINLNTASQAELETLPGIGPKYAQEIIRMRQQAPFRTVDDVAQVRGIGEKRLEAIRPLVTVR